MKSHRNARPAARATWRQRAQGIRAIIGFISLIVAVSTASVARSVQQSCRTVPSTETPLLLASAFASRMAGTGAGVWRLYSNLAEGRLYVSAASSVRLLIKETDGLATSITVMSGEPSEADFVRLQVGANFLAARLSETPEEATRTEVFSLIEQVRSQRKFRARQIGEAVLLVQPMEERAILVTMGRRVCT